MLTLSLWSSRPFIFALSIFQFWLLPGPFLDFRQEFSNFIPFRRALAFSSISQFQLLTHPPMIWVKDWAFSFYLRVESGIIGLVSDRFCDRPSDMESKTFVITVAVVNRNLVDISMTRRWDSVFVAYRIRLYKYRNSLIHSSIFTKWFWGHLLLVARIRRFNQLNLKPIPRFSHPSPKFFLPLRGA